MKADNIIGSALALLFAAMVLFLLYMIFVWLPVDLWAEGKCLAKGYPKTNVTIGLQVYCTNVDGALTVRVEKLQ